ncbi:MAG: hypothetical protein ABL914_12180 [Novosphingobium sp.]|uniref:hypothetical protein n=1 Tax=Novosphingobium sp. TaxID=1874826 RepID=UPI0032BC850D
MTKLKCATLLGAAFILTGFGDNPTAAIQPPPGQGTLCALAIYSLVETVGQKCRAGQDPEFQAGIARIVDKYDAFMLANSTWTAQDLVEFKRKQAATDEPAEAVCKSENHVMFYDAMKKQDIKVQEAGVDQFVSRPGEPTWGDCL